jgi:hypothetical protein
MLIYRLCESSDFVEHKHGDRWQESLYQERISCMGQKALGREKRCHLAQLNLDHQSTTKHALNVGLQILNSRNTLHLSAKDATIFPSVLRPIKASHLTVTTYTHWKRGLQIN